MKKLLKSFLIFLALGFLFGCASSAKITNPLYLMEVRPSLGRGGIDQSLVQAQRKAIEKLQDQMGQGNFTGSGQTLAQKPLPLPTYRYKLNTKKSHPKVQKWIKYYSQKDRERFQRFLSRGARYKFLVQDLLVTNGLPPDLYYLGILESGYVLSAKSRVGATGPWQFMAPTGREYGLKINNYVDERQDPVRSTLAAILYLKELYRQKKSWYLALAAYNAGPGRVKRAMRRGGRVKNYWSLTRRRLLPYDTREYIPQFLAILHIGQNLEKYGFHERIKESLTPMELVKVPAPVKFRKISEITRVGVDEIKKLNPHLIKEMTPPGKKQHYLLWVPQTKASQITASYGSLKKFRIPGLKPRRVISRYRGKLRKRSRALARRKKTKFHRVRSGENLTRIARRYGLSVARLKRLNKLKTGKILKGQRLRLVASNQSLLTSRKAKKKSQKLKRYKIRRGDNLYKIARKFGLTIKRLKKLNNLRGHHIQRGQYLRVVSN